MDYVIEFPLPGQDERARLWRLHLPPDRTSERVDLDALARRYPVPGGWIRNAAIAAAFLAARNDQAIGPEHLEAAMAREYGKALRPSPDGAAEQPGTTDAQAAAALAAWARNAREEEP
jgi:hypothetical protein